LSKIIMFVGLPASGKSTIAKEISKKENAVIHSSDDLRKKIFDNINDEDHNDELFKELHRRIKKDLIEGKNVIYDATNISYKRRKGFLEELKKINCYKDCYLVATPYEICLKRNQERERKVPDYVIKKMYKSFYIPQYYEGWDKINIVWNNDDVKYNLHELFNGENGLNYIDQDNPHHTLTIGKHCLKCSLLCEKTDNDVLIAEAALLHDIGKQFTKSFKNCKGEITKVAHYYQHHLVSAYMSLFYLEEGWFDDDILKITNYIQWHMQPFFIKTEKALNKFINLVGIDFYNKLLILHEADKNAK